MFKFVMVASSKGISLNHIYLNDTHMGSIGIDKEGVYLNLKSDLSLGELNLLIAQLVSEQPTLLKEKVQIAKVD